MQLQQPFNARQVQPSSGYAPPPVLADYHVKIVNSEGKENKEKTGGFIELTLEILDPGPYLGRKIPDRLNISNPNQQTVQIAYGQLSAYCHVTGVFDVSDTRQLWNIPFIATIGPQSGNPQYANVFQVKDLNGNIPGQTPATAAAPAFAAQPATPQAVAAAAPVWPQQPAAPPAAAAPPWPAAPAPVAQPPAAPAWGPPGQPPAQPFAAPPANAQPWQPGATPAAAAPPPWANR